MRRAMNEFVAKALFALLLVISSSSFAIQDPQISSATMDARLKAVDSELSRINVSISKRGTRHADRETLLKKRSDILAERNSLITSKSIGKPVSENPLVRYSGDNEAKPEASKIDKLFEK
jgi:hypothetical protein